MLHTCTKVNWILLTEHETRIVQQIVLHLLHGTKDRSLSLHVRLDRGMECQQKKHHSIYCQVGCGSGSLNYFFRWTKLERNIYHAQIARVICAVEDGSVAWQSHPKVQAPSLRSRIRAVAATNALMVGIGGWSQHFRLTSKINFHGERPKRFVCMTQL